MNEQQLQQVITAVLQKLNEQPAAPDAAVLPADTVAAQPAATAGETAPASDLDITKIDLRQQYLVTAPKDGEAYRALKEKTPARVGIGHAGARYRTATMFQTPTKMGKGILVSPTTHQNILLGPTAQDVSDGRDVGTTAAALAMKPRMPL